ncbi:MAG: glycosyltransferase [Phormidesmis sp.]
MRIVIDLQGCQSASSRNRGIGRYSMALAKAMAHQASDHELWLCLNGKFLEAIAQIRQSFAADIPAERIVVYDFPGPTGEEDTRNLWRLQASERIREHVISCLRPDVVHVSSLFEGIGDSIITSVGVLDPALATAVTLYDLIPLMREETYLENKLIRSWYYRKIESLKKANLLLAISEHSRKEALAALELPEDRIVTVSTAVDDHFRPVQLSVDAVQVLRQRYGLIRPFVMYTGGIDPRKNIEGLIKAYGNLPSDIRQAYQLAIVCSVKTHERERLMALASRYQLAPGEMVLTGFVPDADLVALYNLCELFVFPSLHEGFGLPALEAMSCGAAVIGSSTSSIPEVIGRDDALFDPTRTESITQALHQGLTDPNFRNSLQEFAPQQAAKFSWQASARKTLAAFEQIDEQNRPTTPKIQVEFSAAKPKLAFVSPMPPERSGIANYSAELLPVLAQQYDITLIIDQSTVDGSWADTGVVVKSVDWFKAHAQEFDRRLYQFGNSAFHHHMFELLEQYPGIVTLHDFYLSGVLQWIDIFVGPAGILSQSLYYAHGYLALLSLINEGAEAAVFHFPANKSVIENATGIIIHSQYSKDLANQWYGKGASQNWQLVPHLHSSTHEISKSQAREKLQIKDEDLLICSFGLVAPTKLNQRLLSAWLASKLANNERCHLVFVGENHSGNYGQQLLTAIQQAGMTDRVKITGFASSEIYHQYLAAADMAVQLRTLSRGETSGAVLEAMLYQLPLIVNGHGTMADYPDHAVMKLPDDFSDRQLTQALETLYTDAALRQDLGQKGYQYITQHHNPDKVGTLYCQAIEAFVADSPYARYQRLLASFKTIESSASPREEDLVATAEAIARNTGRFGRPQLLVDVSCCLQNRLKESDKGTVRATVLRLLKQSSQQCRVEPIYADGKIYRYARQFSLELLGIGPVKGLEDDPVDISRKDLFLGIDTATVLTAQSYYGLMRWHQLGVQMYLAIFDDIFTAQPQWSISETKPETQEWAQVIIDIADHVLCASAELFQQLKGHLSANVTAEQKLPSVDQFELISGPNQPPYIDFLEKIDQPDKSS